MTSPLRFALQLALVTAAAYAAVSFAAAAGGRRTVGLLPRPRGARRGQADRPAAIDAHVADETMPSGPNYVRPAGREAMRDPYRRWDGVDEASDESFPASDPPATY